MAIALGAVVALIAGLFVFNSPRRYRGKTLNDWLQEVNILTTRNPHSNTNALLAFHDAGPAGVQWLLREAASAESRLNWLLFDLDQNLNRRGWLRQSWFRRWTDPKGRALAAYEVMLQLPPLTEESLQVLTNDFAGLASQISNRSHGSGELPMQATGQSDFSQSQILKAQQKRLNIMAHWILRQGEPGLRFLTNQAFASTSTANQGAILSALGGLDQLGPELVPTVVHIARNPELTFAAAQLLTRLRIEPAVAVPGLVQSLTNHGVVSLSLLAEWGTNASPWLPQILPLTTNSDPQISFQAGSAVRKIQGR